MDSKVPVGLPILKDMESCGSEDEESWIEEDDYPEFKDLFADPDPMTSFTFTFPRPGGESITITLRGVKAENGQTLKSTGLTIWRASPLLCNFLAANPNTVRAKTVLELGAGRRQIRRRQGVRLHPV